MPGRFFGVGLGPGDPGWVTRRAAEVLQQVEVIYSVASRQGDRSVSGAILDALPGIAAERVELEFTMSRDFGERLARIDEHAARIFAVLAGGGDAAFVTIGDAMTYSTCGYLLRALRRLAPELEVEIVPGVNSWSGLAAAFATPLAEDGEPLRIIPSSVMPTPEGLDAQLGNGGTSILLKTYRNRNQLLDLLAERPYDLLYGADLGLESEFISADPAAIRARPAEYLSILMCREKRDRVWEKPAAEPEG